MTAVLATPAGTEGLDGGEKGGARHLYVHLPFCAHRCGYCDFVVVVGHADAHRSYADALLAELELERHLLADELETVYLGGGTPTFTAPSELERVLAALPPAREVTVEANPETVTPALARMLRRLGVDRVSLGVQSFQPHLLAVLERRAGPDAARRAVHDLRGASIDNVSLDLLYGIPGQSTDDLERDLEQAVALEPEHLSCYELEAKPGTRFTRAHGHRLALAAEETEGYFELVVERLLAAGYRWYETANFCRPGREAAHNLAYWLGRDYLGLGVGAVSTIGTRRWRNRPGLRRYIGALERGEAPPREVETIDPATKRRERLMLGLRLEQGVELEGLSDVVDGVALERLERLGLIERRGAGIALSRRGRFVGGAATVELLAG